MGRPPCVFSQSLEVLGDGVAEVEVLIFTRSSMAPFPSRYLKSTGVPIAVAKTGVKFVHHEAEKYDIGVYFEANGHGTVLFKDKVLERLREAREVRQCLLAAGLVAWYQRCTPSPGLRRGREGYNRDSREPGAADCG